MLWQQVNKILRSLQLLANTCAPDSFRGKGRVDMHRVAVMGC